MCLLVVELTAYPLINSWSLFSHLENIWVLIMVTFISFPTKTIGPNIMAQGLFLTLNLNKQGCDLQSACEMRWMKLVGEDNM